MVPLKLLVVDDETDFAEFVAEVALGMGFDVQSTGDPEEFATLYSADLDIVVLDLFMPGMDGIELLRFLSNNNCEASVVFMSGKDMGVLHSARELALEQGISVLGTLQKPFRIAELREVLSNFVQRPSIKDTGTDELPSLGELHTAIEKQECFLVYQPQVNIATRQVIGVEALLRWKHSTKGMIPPSYFIPVAEENCLISEIDSVAATTAITQLGLWQRIGLNLRMSINMSTRVLDDLDLPEKLATSADELGADIENITFEVTETALVTDVSRYLDILARLRMKGFNLAIDDFGIGYSSLEQLVRAPFTELKIDQTFIKNLETDAECRTVVETSVLLAHQLGMHVVAEGIENEAVWNILQELGCNRGQGYWIGRPLPPEEIEPWVLRWSSSLVSSCHG
jgi:EAL domain-containing protein (putative c-di-GMP-specific phosphodiesterase class I)/ActR/RegA family two-component response regulator